MTNRADRLSSSIKGILCPAVSVLDDRWLPEQLFLHPESMDRYHDVDADERSVDFFSAFPNASSSGSSRRAGLQGVALREPYQLQSTER